MTRTIILIITFFAAASLGGTDIVKDDAFLDEGIGYYKVVKVGNTLYISGCTGWGDSMEEQLDVAYGKIRERLAKYEAGFEAVVKETIYSTDLEATKAAIPHRKEILEQNYYAATWVEVKALWMPEIKVEIEVIAILPD